MFVCFHAQANKAIVLSEQAEEVFIGNADLLVLEDRERIYAIDQIAQLPDSLFRNPGDHFTNKNTGSWYWIRIRVRNESDRSDWVLEQFNYRISDLRLYEKAQEGDYKEISLGDDREFKSRIFLHKNLIFPLYLQKGEEKELHLRFSSALETPFQLVVRSSVFFTSYAIGEYFLLGLFYGVILIFALYNFILFFSIRDKVYLWYVFYVLSFGVFFMVHDGTCYQYLWPNLPVLNKYGYSTFLTLTVIGMIFYSKIFLEMKNSLPYLNRILNYYAGFRVGFYLAGFFLPQIREVTYLDVFPFLVIYIGAVVRVKSGYRPALFFLISSTVLLAAFMVHVIRALGIIPSNVFTFYFLYLAPLIDVVLLSFALSERIKEIRNTQLYSEKLNSELEKKVAERTEALLLQNEVVQDKIRDLDSFIYKVSHDIKGPLKSMMGLAQTAKVDKKEAVEKYLDYIIRTGERLDSVVSDLLTIAKLSSSRLRISPVNVNELINEVIDAFSGHPEFSSMSFPVKIEEETQLYTERTLLSSVFQNIVENAINYRNPNVSSFLKIQGKVTGETLTVSFEDNGIGIQEEYLEKVFEMFFRAEEAVTHKSTGLGLYMVKMALEKIEGSINVSSELGVGSKFTLIIRNFPPSSEDTEEKIAGVGLA